MEHRFEKMDSFKVAGLDVDCTHEDISAIEPLWDKFNGRLKDVRDCQGVYGVCFDQPGGFKYVAGAMIGPPQGTPDGLRIWDVPAAKYVVYDFCGKPEEMSKMFHEIFTTHLKAAGLCFRENCAVLERYPEDCIDEATGKLKAELLVPVKE